MTRPRKKPAKMKAVMAWAQVYVDDNMMRGIDTWAPQIHKTRKIGRKEVAAVNAAFGPICRIARVKITEVER